VAPVVHDIVNQENAFSLDAVRAERLRHILAARAIAETCLGRRGTQAPQRSYDGNAGSPG